MVHISERDGLMEDLIVDTLHNAKDATQLFADTRHKTLACGKGPRYIGQRLENRTEWASGGSGVPEFDWLESQNKSGC